jgi:hypothetical protein
MIENLAAAQGSTPNLDLGPAVEVPSSIRPATAMTE